MNSVFALERPLIVFDLETTGLKTETARIVELGFRLFTQEGMIKHYLTLVNPDMPITNSDKHHVTNELLKRCQSCQQLPEAHPLEDCEQFKRVPYFKEIAANIARGFSNCDFAGKNIRYDLAVLTAEMQREGISWSYVGACIIDADRLEQLGEPRTLAALYQKHTGKRLEGAHRALVDVDATIEVIVSQLQKYLVLPRQLRQLHELQWPGWIDTEGKFRFDEGGVPRCGFGKYRGVALQQIPANYWKWIRDADFSTEIKELAGNAMQGKYPVRL